MPNIQQGSSYLCRMIFERDFPKYNRLLGRSRYHPEGKTFTSKRGRQNVVLMFVKSEDDIRECFASLTKTLGTRGIRAEEIRAKARQRARSAIQAASAEELNDDPFSGIVTRSVSKNTERTITVRISVVSPEDAWCRDTVAECVRELIDQTGCRVTFDTLGQAEKYAPGSAV